MTATATRDDTEVTTRSASKTAAKAAAKSEKKSFLKSKKGILLIVAVLVVGGGAYKFLMPKKVGPPTGGDVVALDPNTVNLAGGHYLQIAVGIQLVKGRASATSFETSHAAELVIDEFSNRTVAALSTNAARDKLHTQLETELKKAYPGEVYDLFFTKFVTQ